VTRAKAKAKMEEVLILGGANVDESRTRLGQTARYIYPWLAPHPSLTLRWSITPIMDPRTILPPAIVTQS
jgi:hypothetical protein